MSERQELQKQFRQQQEKYVYYLLALSVACIGFTIHKTTGLGLSYSQILAGLAVLSWASSMYCGLLFLRYIISTLFANDTYLEIIDGDYPEIGNHLEMQQSASTGVMKAMISNSNKAEKLSKWQNRLFFMGMISFLIWHIIEMFLISCKCQ